MYENLFTMNWTEFLHFLFVVGFKNIFNNYFKIFSNDLSASWVALSNSLMVSHKNRYDERMSYQQRVWRHRGSIIHSYYSSMKILASKKHSKIKLKPSRKVWICIFEQLVHQVNYLSEVLILQLNFWKKWNNQWQECILYDSFILYSPFNLS